MADLPGAFWAGWIAVITVVSLVGLAWLVYSLYFSAPSAEEEGQDQVWDENLEEGANPAPMWWFWLIFALLVFSAVYLILYPGLGSYAGALQWSQGSRLEQSFEKFSSEFGGIRRLIADAKLDTLHGDSALMASALGVYNRNCAACHGVQGKGVSGYFPDLTDAAWQWGGEPGQIEQSIRKGRLAVMVGWLPALGDEGVRQLTNYTQALSAGSVADHPGATLYAQYCIACHGPAGGGNPLLGASNLADDVWLYGGDKDAIEYSIAIGRSGQMPAFEQRLDDTQIKLLVALLTRENWPEPGGS